MNELVPRMFGYIYGNWTTMVTFVYADLGIADALAEGEATAEELADRTGTDAAALGRVLSCAEALGFHDREADSGRLRLRPLGGLLRSDGPFSLRAAARLNGARYRYDPWGRLPEYVETGSGRGLSPTWDEGSLPWLAGRPAELDVFQAAMTSLSHLSLDGVEEARTLAGVLALGGRHTVVDVGGGRGAFLRAVLEKHPEATGILFDLPSVLADVSAADFGPDAVDRIRFEEGDFLERVPGGFDAYLLKNVIHNHRDERVLRLFRNIADAMREPGDLPADDRRLFLFELMPSDDAPRIDAVFSDLNLSLLVGGGARREDELRRMLNASGLDLMSIRSVSGLTRRILEVGLLSDARR